MASADRGAEELRDLTRAHMPEFRKDPVVGRWVIVSPERARRPQDAQLGDGESAALGSCPFCAGNEAMTPPEVLSYRTDGSLANLPGWTLRVVPNKYPALVNERDGDSLGDGFYELTSGLGVHEVIIETPEHMVNMAALRERQFEDALRAYCDRILELRADKRWRYILIYKNQGAAAGATLEHIHSQLVALPLVPSNALEEINGAKKFYETKGRCIFCEVIQHERSHRKRIVAEHERFVVLCPFASRFPYETWILPKRHSARFEAGFEREKGDLARCLRETLIRVDVALKRPPFNYFIHSNPLHGSDDDCYHWHVEIMPKLTQVAGFEWGSGFYINTVAPEEAARRLRQVTI